MGRHYVTFGQSHVHELDGEIYDKDCVAVYEADSYASGRERAFVLFGDKFFTDYHGEQWDEDKMLKFFPRGYIDVDYIYVDVDLSEVIKLFGFFEDVLEYCDCLGGIDYETYIRKMDVDGVLMCDLDIENNDEGAGYFVMGPMCTDGSLSDSVRLDEFFMKVSESLDSDIDLFISWGDAENAHSYELGGEYDEIDFVNHLVQVFEVCVGLVAGEYAEVDLCFACGIGERSVGLLCSGCSKTILN